MFCIYVLFHDFLRFQSHCSTIQMYEIEGRNSSTSLSFLLSAVVFIYLVLIGNLSTNEINNVSVADECNQNDPTT